jgi:2-octaprenyl-3-methyl-6-methoxy-1,4-benzoquinol hydroxylase
MTIQQAGVAVVGGGMVGGALALGLAQQGFDVTVIEQATPPAFDASQKPDVRISAISAASVDLLRRLGVWEAVLLKGPLVGPFLFDLICLFQARRPARLNNP